MWGCDLPERAAPVAGAPSCRPSIGKERAVGCQHRLRGARGENAEGMNGATHGAYMTWGARWMEQGALSTLHEGDCLAGVGEECECWCG